MLPPLPKPQALGYTAEDVYEYGRWVAARCVTTCIEIRKQIDDDGGKLNCSEALNHVAATIQRKFANDTQTLGRQE